MAHGPSDEMIIRNSQSVFRSTKVRPEKLFFEARQEFAASGREFYTFSYPGKYGKRFVSCFVDQFWKKP